MSVVVPMYNAADLIAAQIEALGRQDFEGEWEVVVADNGSTDSSVDVVRRLEGVVPRLRLIDASHRRGAAAARNLGTSVTEGVGVAYCDADDVVDPSWLRHHEESLRRADVVGGRFDLDSFGDVVTQQRQFRR